MARIARVASLVAATLVLAVASGGPASAQEPRESAPEPAKPAPARPAGQGIAVLAIGPARDEAFALARAVYGSRLRPTSLDEVRARVLAGADPPANASRELRELAEVRAGIATEDAGARRLLTGLAQQVGAEALLVVRVERASEAGAGNAAPRTTVLVRMFLRDLGDFDAARYAPDPGLEGPAAWKSTVTSLEARFPSVFRTVGPTLAASPSPVKIKPEDEKSSSFYASGWFWGAVGAAALLGGAFYFATRDTGSDAIHLQLKVPR